jgi:hypothetical protein
MTGTTQGDDVVEFVCFGGVLERSNGSQMMYVRIPSECFGILAAVLAFVLVTFEGCASNSIPALSVPNRAAFPLMMPVPDDVF